MNTVNDDGTDIAALMSCFTKKKVNSSRFPKMSGKVRELKETEGGQKAVCKIMEKYETAAREEGIEIGVEKGKEIGREEGREEGQKQTQISNIRKMMNKLKMTADLAMDLLDIPEEEKGKYVLLLKEADASGQYSAEG